MKVSKGNLHPLTFHLSSQRLDFQQLSAPLKRNYENIKSSFEGWSLDALGIWACRIQIQNVFLWSLHTSPNVCPKVNRREKKNMIHHARPVIISLLLLPREPLVCNTSELRPAPAEWRDTERRLHHLHKQRPKPRRAGVLWHDHWRRRLDCKPLWSHRRLTSVRILQRNT